MSQRIRKHLTPATVIAVLALVFAMSGGAYAASRYVITSSRQISPTVLKSLQGKAGAAGKNGANGANGAAGAQGPQGPAGASGSSGQGVTSAEFTGARGSCKEGGTEFTSASGTTYACKGVKGKGGEGPPGPEGSPWTVGGTLPAGQAETGTWSYVNAEEKNALAYASISFPIQLKEPLDKFELNEEEEEVSTQVHVILYEETAPEGCKGGSIKDPVAEPGNLCIYSRDTDETAHLIIPIEPKDVEKSNSKVGAGKTGTTLLAFTEAGASNYGVWIVRAPAES